MNFCSQCGQGNQDDATFCVQCGAPLAATGQAGGEAPPAEPGAVATQGQEVGGITPPVTPGGVAAPVQPPPGAPYQPPPGQPYYPPPVPRGLPTDGFAIASLVLAIFSFMGCPFVAAILGLIFGYMSLSHIEESNGTLGGEPLAKAGIIISWIHIGLALFVGVLILILVLVGVITTS